MDPIEVLPEFAGDRLDAWLSAQLDDYSRTRLKNLIKEGHVRVNGHAAKPTYALRAGDVVSGEVPAPQPIAVEPEDIPLHIIYEDGDIIVINKPAGLVVHPAPGNYSGTLVNALLHHCSDLRGIGGELRPGIVHRLDKNTSGAIIVAKNEPALNHLALQFRERHIGKTYQAVVWGQPVPEADRIEQPIARHHVHRKKMGVDVEHGRYALSIYRSLEKFTDHSLLSVEIKTGRTHQIRVHLSHIGHPIVGDTVYGKARNDALPLPVHRQMLHAYQLEITHPRSEEPMNFVADIPPDMQNLIQQLRT